MQDVNYLVDSFILAVALSVDASVVSFSQGLILTRGAKLFSLVLAFCVGFFQFFMPLIGWFAAKFVHSYVEGFARWIAFGIFMILGLKIIADAIFDEKKQQEKSEEQNDAFSFKFLLAVSVATSIDALGAGVSFNLLNRAILFPAVLIGVITFINSLVGFWCGHCFKKSGSNLPRICAGIILILLAIKNF